ncbi:MAG TPA: hypothetical protein VGY56_21495 [Verrucomicrobiae bacterium]|nr:hypothetical protein [Verrucomicrobiae bacterium]
MPGFPMWAGLTFHVAPVKLVQSLKRNGTAFFGAEQFRDLLPRFALLAQCADVVCERLNATAVCFAAAAPSPLSIFGFQIHRRQFTPEWACAVSE